MQTIDILTIVSTIVVIAVLFFSLKNLSSPPFQSSSEFPPPPFRADPKHVPPPKKPTVDFNFLPCSSQKDSLAMLAMADEKICRAMAEGSIPQIEIDYDVEIVQSESWEELKQTGGFTITITCR